MGDSGRGGGGDWRSFVKSAAELAVGGVPNSLRVRVWSQASGAAQLMARYPTHFADMLAIGSQMHEHDRNESARAQRTDASSLPSMPSRHSLAALPPSTC